jgi:hypothetical protein
MPSSAFLFFGLLVSTMPSGLLGTVVDRSHPLSVALDRCSLRVRSIREGYVFHESLARCLASLEALPAWLPLQDTTDPLARAQFWADTASALSGVGGVLRIARYCRQQQVCCIRSGLCLLERERERAREVLSQIASLALLPRGAEIHTPEQSLEAASMEFARLAAANALRCDIDSSRAWGILNADVPPLALSCDGSTAPEECFEPADVTLKALGWFRQIVWAGVFERQLNQVALAHALSEPRNGVWSFKDAVRGLYWRENSLPSRLGNGWTALPLLVVKQVLESLVYLESWEAGYATSRLSLELFFDIYPGITPLHEVFQREATTTWQQARRDMDDALWSGLSERLDGLHCVAIAARAIREGVAALGPAVRRQLGQRQFERFRTALDSQNCRVDPSRTLASSPQLNFGPALDDAGAPCIGNSELVTDLEEHDTILTISKWHAARGRGLVGRSDSLRPPVLVLPVECDSNDEAISAVVSEAALGMALTVPLRLSVSFPNCSARAHPRAFALTAGMFQDSGLVDPFFMTNFALWGGSNTTFSKWVRMAHRAFDKEMRTSAAKELILRSMNRAEDAWPETKQSEEPPLYWTYDISRELAAVWRRRGSPLSLAPRWIGTPPPPPTATYQESLARTATIRGLEFFSSLPPQLERERAIELMLELQELGPGLQIALSMDHLDAAAVVTYALASRLRAFGTVDSSPDEAMQSAIKFAVGFPESSAVAWLLVGQAQRLTGLMAESLLAQAACVRWNPTSPVSVFNVATNTAGPMRDAGRTLPIIAWGMALQRAGLTWSNEATGGFQLDDMLASGTLEVLQHQAVALRQWGPGTPWASIVPAGPTMTHPTLGDWVFDDVTSPLLVDNTPPFSDELFSTPGTLEHPSPVAIDAWRDDVDGIGWSRVPGDWMWIMPPPGGVRATRPVSKGTYREPGVQRATGGADEDRVISPDWQERSPLLRVAAKMLWRISRALDSGYDSAPPPRPERAWQVPGHLTAQEALAAHRIQAIVSELTTPRLVPGRGTWCPTAIVVAAAHKSLSLDLGESEDPHMACMDERLNHRVNEAVAAAEHTTTAILSHVQAIAEALFGAPVNAPCTCRRGPADATAAFQSLDTILQGTHPTKSGYSGFGHEKTAMLFSFRATSGDSSAGIWHAAAAFALRGGPGTLATAAQIMIEVVKSSRWDIAESRRHSALTMFAALRAMSSHLLARDLAMLVSSLKDHTAVSPSRELLQSVTARSHEAFLGWTGHTERPFFLSYHGRGLGSMLYLSGFSALVRASDHHPVGPMAVRLRSLQQQHEGLLTTYRSLQPLLDGIPSLSTQELIGAVSQCAARPSIGREGAEGEKQLFLVFMRNDRGSVIKNASEADPWSVFIPDSGHNWWRPRHASRPQRDDNSATQGFSTHADRLAAQTAGLVLPGDASTNGVMDPVSDASNEAWRPLQPRPLSLAERLAFERGGDPCLALGLRRARVGFFSNYFVKEHPHGHVLRAAIIGLEKAFFEIVLARLPSGSMPLDSGLAEIADAIVDVRRSQGAGLRRAANTLSFDAAIFSDQLAVPMTYELGFSKVAPVTAAFGGDPTTSGHAHMLDYYVGGDRTEGDGPDAAMVPNGMEFPCTSLSSSCVGASLYTEQLFRLEGQGFSYDPAPETIAPALARNFSRFGLPAGGGNGVTSVALIGCIQSSFKMSPLMDDVFASLLRSLPQARIVVIAARHRSWQARLETRWNRVMPDITDRILVIPRVPPGEDYMAALSCMDVLIHPTPFDGSRTAADSLAAQVPFVVMPSRFVTARMGRALLISIGAKGLLASSPTHFIRIISQLVRSPSLRAEFRAELIKRSALAWDRREVPLHWQMFLQTVLQMPLRDRVFTRQRLGELQLVQSRQFEAVLAQSTSPAFDRGIPGLSGGPPTPEESAVWGASVAGRLVLERALYSAGEPLVAEWELPRQQSM